jgi:fructose-bisphosphate aldolase class I
MVAKGKGILAADESMGTIKRRFDSIKIESNDHNRRAYRDMLFTTKGIEEAISGVILFDETIRTAALDGTPFPQVLAKKGIMPGIKVDKGPVDLPGFPGEVVTEGLDGLRARVKEYKELGAKFAKWRAVISIGDGIPTYTCLEANAHALARYAALCQEGGIVPIVEPEVLLDGSHTIERCQDVTEQTLKITFHELFLQRVYLEGMILKPSMVVSGKENPRQAGVEEVAERTLQCLKRTVPAAVPGIAFLSGGQSAERATEHLNAMNAMGSHPWEVSFSYARALQDPAIKAWKGEAANVAAAQQIFYHRAKCNSAARSGKYNKQMEAQAA